MKYKIIPILLCLFLIEFATVYKLKSAIISPQVQVAVGWDLSNDFNIIGYNIYINNQHNVFINHTNAGYTNIITINLSQGMHYICATSYDINGNESGFSNMLGVYISDTNIINLPIYKVNTNTLPKLFLSPSKLTADMIIPQAWSIQYSTNFIQWINYINGSNCAIYHDVTNHGGNCMFYRLKIE